MKQLYYNIAFIKNYIKYSFTKVNIPFFEVWVGQRCTLRCKECCHLIPYVEPKLFDIEELISDCKRILKCCNIAYFSILGGEPFCNHELYKLLDFVAECDEITDGKIVTNGTVLLDDKTITSLKKLNGKLIVSIDKYPNKEKICNRFHNLLTENGIKCRMNEYTDWNWKHTGDNTQKALSPESSQIIFSTCWVKDCYTLCDGEFTTCPRGITSYSVFGLPKNKFENVVLADYKSSRTLKAMLATAMDKKYYKDYCLYCLGLTKLNPYDITPGVQMSKGK